MRPGQVPEVREAAGQDNISAQSFGTFPTDVNATVMRSGTPSGVLHNPAWRPVIIATIVDGIKGIGAGGEMHGRNLRSRSKIDVMRSVDGRSFGHDFEMAIGAGGKERNASDADQKETKIF